MPVSKLLKLPYGSYLMVRLDYVIICGDELEAKIMRIIEMYMDDERKHLYKELLNNPQNEIDKDAEVDITRDVWAAISHRLFKNDLYDQDMSENTLKRALKSLRKKNFILVRDKGLTRYEAPKYQINTEIVQAELNLLSKLGKTGYQKLMVSKIDGIKNASHQNETPSDRQILTVSSDSRVSKIDPNSRKVYEVEGRVEEDTYTELELVNNDSGASAPPHSQSELHVLPLPEGDAILVERLGKNSLRYYRKSGRPIGELIPVGMDVEEGLRELHTVEADGEFPMHAPSLYDAEELGQRIYEASRQDPATLPPIMQSQDEAFMAAYQALIVQPREERAQSATAALTAPSQVPERPQETAPAQQLSTAASTSPQQSAKSSKRREKPEQPTLPLQVDLGPLVMPGPDATWTMPTVVLITEVLRGKRYTDGQRANQEGAAKRMLRDFTEMTRTQFETIFAESVKWWREHGQGILTLAEIMSKSKSGEVRLQTSLDRLEAQQNKSNPSPPSGPPRFSGNPQPKDSGMVEWHDEAGNWRMMTYAEADEHGWAGGFGEFIQHTSYGKVATR